MGNPSLFLKQSYDLDDFRVQTHKGLQKLVVLVVAAAYFTATLLGTKTETAPPDE